MPSGSPNGSEEPAPAEQSAGGILNRLKRSNVTLAAASIAVTILIAEIGLRIAGVAYPEFNRLDPMLGWSPRPGIEGIYAVEGRTWIAINSEGFRDIDHPIEKPADTLRIAVLGDSFAEGREVPLEQVFWKVMEGGMSACLEPKGRKVEVIGFAVNGYGTAQQVLVLESRVPKYKPDLVLFTMFTGNDIANNSRAIDGHPDRPYFVLSEYGLHLDDAHLRSGSFLAKRLWSGLKLGLFNMFRTVQVARQAYVALKARFKYSNLDVSQQLTAGLSGKLYKPPTDAVWEDAWAVTEALIKRAAASASAQGARLVLATLSNPIQVTPDLDLRSEAATALDVPNLLYPDRRLADFANVAEIPVFTLAERLAVHAAGSGQSLHGRKSFAGGHWNERGHRVAGEMLAGELCRLVN